MADEEAMLAKVQASWAQTAARDKARYADERVPEDVHWETEYRYEQSADPQQTPEPVLSGQKTQRNHADRHRYSWWRVVLW